MQVSFTKCTLQGCVLEQAAGEVHHLCEILPSTFIASRVCHVHKITLGDKQQHNCLLLKKPLTTLKHIENPALYICFCFCF